MFFFPSLFISPSCTRAEKTEVEINKGETHQEKIIPLSLTKELMQKSAVWEHFFIPMTNFPLFTKKCNQEADILLHFLIKLLFCPFKSYRNPKGK